MAGKRKVHTAAFKAQVALAALKGDRTVNELAGHYGVHPTLIHGWKKQLLTGAEASSGSPAQAASADAEARQAELFEQIGRLKMELEWLKKKLPSSCEHKRPLVEHGHPALSVRRQCELLGLSRSSLYYEPGGEAAEDLRLMRLIDEQYTARPFYGSRRMTIRLNERGEGVNRKRVQRLMRVMGLEAIYPKPRSEPGREGAPDLPVPAPGREGREEGSGLEHRHHVRADALGVHVPGGGDRLVQPVRDRLAAVEHARRVVLPGDARRGLEGGRPEVFNTDQGVQFTAAAFTGRLESAGVAVSMDGRGRALDNVFVERLWRSVKYEDIYIQGYDTVPGLHRGLARYFAFYNDEQAPSVARLPDPGGRLPGHGGRKGLTRE